MRRQLALLGTLVLSCGSATAQSWQHMPGFDAIGRDGLAVADMDGDGSNEVVFTATSRSLDYAGVGAYALGVAQERSGVFHPRGFLLGEAPWTSPLLVAPGASGDRIFGQRRLRDGSGFEFVEFSGVPPAIVRTIRSELEVALVGAVDVDGDGVLELVGAAGYSWSAGPLVIIDASSGLVEWMDTTPLRSFPIAQLDADLALELIVHREQGAVIDGATRALEWSYPPGFGGTPIVGRLTDPFSTEFASFGSSGFRRRLTIFRGAPYSPLREIELQPDSGNVVDVSVLDIDADGVDEVLTAGGQWQTAVDAYDTVDGTVTPYPADGVHRLAAGSLGQSGFPGLLFASETGIDLHDQLRVVDAGNGETRFALHGAQGPFSALTIGDFDGDQDDELLFPLRAADGHGRWRTFCRLHLATGAVEHCLDGVETPASWYFDRSPVVGQFDADAADEFAWIDGSELVVYDGVSLRPIRRSLLPPVNADVRAIAGIDFDDDTLTDVVAVTMDSKIFVLSGDGGDVLWSSVTLGEASGSYRPLVRVHNVDADPAPEVVMTSAAGIFAFDSNTKLLDWSIATANATSLLHLWGEGADCRIAANGAVAEALDVLRCDTRLPTMSVALPENTRMARPENAEADTWIVAADGRLLTVQGDAVRAWSDYLGFDLGAGDNAIMLPRARGGVDVLIGSDTLVTRIRVDRNHIFEDAFELTDH